MARSRFVTTRPRSRTNRQFVWWREFGTLTLGGGAGNTFGVDLLAAYRATAGSSQTGSTVMRVRGYIHPNIASGSTANGTFGLIVDSTGTPLTELSTRPESRPTEEWLGWLPWFSPTGHTVDEATWNSPWTVDIKANRKVGELGQSLFLFVSSFPGAVEVNYNLSIGLKAS